MTDKRSEIDRLCNARDALKKIMDYHDPDCHAVKRIKELAYQGLVESTESGEL